MQTLWQDVRYALRQLRKAPGFTATAVLILALGIGANAAIFTLVHAVLLRNLPVVDPSTLVRLGDRDECCVEGGTQDHDDYVIFAYDLYRHIQAATASDFEQLAAVQSAAWRLSIRGSKPGAVAKALPSEYVSGNYFQTFGLTPSAGRLLTPADDQPNAAPVAVMTYQAWQRDYGRDPSIIGSTFFFNTKPVTLVGIAPEGYYGDRMDAQPTNFFVPFSAEPVIAQSSLLHEKGSNWVYILGRVKPGTAWAPLESKISASLRGYLQVNVEMYQKVAFAKNLANAHVKLTPGGAGIANMQTEAADGLHLLMGISALVLLIACANLANLVLVRGMARGAETSLRMALGAQRVRILRQMLTESVVLSAIGGAAGLVVAYAGTKALLALAFPDSPEIPIHAVPSGPVLLFAIGISLATGLVFGLAPAWITSHAQPAEALRGVRSSTRGSASLLQRGLVVLQAALSLVLLIGAGLLSKSLNRLEHQDFGLQTANRYVMHIDAASAGYQPEQLQALHQQLLDGFHAIPGVEHVGLSTYSPLEGDNWGEGVNIEGRPEPGPNDDVGASWTRVTPEFFDLIGQHVLRGRNVNDQDTATSPGVAVVNQTFVKKFFKHGENPLGVHFGTNGMKSTSDMTIVGVVNDVKYVNPREPTRPMYFRPFLQSGRSSLPKGEGRALYAGALMLETRGPIDGLEAKSRQVLAGINPNLPLVNFTTFEDQIAGQFSQDRLIARLTMLFGVLALVLASVGLYGVTAYTVARRTSEIGIRMALGAGRGSVVAMVLRGALVQAGLGLALGIPVALFAARLLKSQLYGVGGTDAAVLVGAVVTLAVAATLAGLIPARRAATIDPMQALRTE